MSDKSHEWLVIFLLHEDYHLDKIQRNEPGYVSLDVQRKSLFRSIRNSEFDERIKIIIIESKVEPSEVSEASFVSHSYFIERVRFGFRRYDLSDFNIQKGDLLVKVLEKIISKERALQSMLVTWGHGSVFGVFYVESLVQALDFEVLSEKSIDDNLDYNVEAELEKTIEDVNIFRTLSPLSITSAAINSLFHEFDLLTNRELADAIKLAIGKIDVLIMYNCLMQNVCTQYDLMGAVDYLIAPETGITHPGYNYTAILDYLKTQGGVVGSQVATKAIQSIRINPFLTANLERVLENTWCVRGIDLSDFNVFSESFTHLITEMRSLKFGTVLPLLKNALSDCFNYAKHSLPAIKIIDLKVFLISLQDEHDIKTKGEFKSLRLKIQDCLTAIDPGTNVLFGKTLFPITKNDSPDTNSGFGILLPKGHGDIDQIRIAFIKNEELHPEFYVKTGYIGLLREILSLD